MPSPRTGDDGSRQLDPVALGLLGGIVAGIAMVLFILTIPVENEARFWAGG